MASPTSPHHRIPAAPHPRRFIWLCGGTIIITVCLYLLVIVYPAYVSGIYRSDDPTQSVFLVPFYSTGLGTRHGTDRIWTISLMVIISTFFVCPPLSVALVVVLLRKWTHFPHREQRFWVITVSLAWLIVGVTFWWAVRFVVWIAD